MHTHNIGDLHWLQPHYQNNVFHLLHWLSLLSLALFPPRPKRMHFLTGPRCKVLIVGLRGTRFIPCILNQFGLWHRGLILKQRSRKELAPDKSTRPGCLFSPISCTQPAPYKSFELSQQSGPFVQQNQLAEGFVWKDSAILLTQLDRFLLDFVSKWIFFFFPCMRREVGDFFFFWDVLNPPVLQRAPRAFHLFSYTNSIRGLITGH